MRAALIIIGALALAGCAEVPPRDANSESASTGGVEYIGGNVSKICDAGRAVYVFDGYRSGGVDVVDMAPECMGEPGVVGVRG